MGLLYHHLINLPSQLSFGSDVIDNMSHMIPDHLIYKLRHHSDNPVIKAREKNMTKGIFRDIS